MKFFLILIVLAMSFSAYSTTAVLCGTPAKVDENNDAASVWIIFDHDDGHTVDTTNIRLKGKDATVVAVKEALEELFLTIAKPDATIVINKNDIQFCTGDDAFFNIRMIVKSSSTKISKCRCFAD